MTHELMHGIIRLIEYADVARVVRLFDAVVSAYPAYISHSELQLGIAIDRQRLHPDRVRLWEEDLRAHIAAFPSGVLLAEDGDEIVGFVVAAVVRGADHTYGVVEDICVAPEWRGRGIGRRLFLGAVAQLEQAGARSVFLESGIDNASTHVWVERLGFAPVSMVFQADISVIALRERRRPGDEPARKGGGEGRGGTGWV